MYRVLSVPVRVQCLLSSHLYRRLAFAWYRRTGRPGRPRRLRSPFVFLSAAQLSLPL